MLSQQKNKNSREKVKPVATLCLINQKYILQALSARAKPTVTIEKWLDYDVPEKNFVQTFV